MILKINVDDTELWDEDKEEFVRINKQVLRLEHSLYSISKWESIWKKSFLYTEQKTDEELYSYIQCMCVDEVPMEVIMSLSVTKIKTIIDFMEDQKTATTITNYSRTHGRRTQIVTSELIYYWMTELNIPFECEHWHLSRLMTLIEVCNVEKNPDDKMSKKETIEYHRALNAARRKKKA